MNTREGEDSARRNLFLVRNTHEDEARRSLFVLVYDYRNMISTAIFAAHDTGAPARAAIAAELTRRGAGETVRLLHIERDTGAALWQLRRISGRGATADDIADARVAAFAARAAVNSDLAILSGMSPALHAALFGPPKENR